MLLDGRARFAAAPFQAVIVTLFLTLMMMLIPHGASAGVVLSESEVTTELSNSTTVNRTVLVQGHKQKVETPSHDTITDLDNGVIYVIYPSRKSYLEIPIPMRPKAQVKSYKLVLKRTGSTHQSEGYACDEYKGTRHLSSRLQVSATLCVAQQGPAARELGSFQHELIAMLNGPQGADAQDAGLTIAQNVTLSAKQSASRGSGKVPLVQVQKQVKRIEIKSLPPAAFKPPAGYQRIRVSDGNSIAV